MCFPILKWNSIIRSKISSGGYAEKVKTVNHIINEYNKLAQKEYKTWNNRARKVTQRELNFYHVTKRYMHKPESVEEIGFFGLVSLFNGISTFVGYLMPKLFS